MSPVSAQMAPLAGPTPADSCRPENVLVDGSVGHLIKCVMASLLSASDRRLGSCDLTGPQCSLLLRVRMNGKATMSELAKALATDTGAVTRMVDRLERKNLLLRTQVHPDRRVVNVELTGKGAALIPKASQVMDQSLDAHLAGFSSEEIRSLASQLKRMLVNGEAMRGEACETQPRDCAEQTTSGEPLPA